MKKEEEKALQNAIETLQKVLNGSVAGKIETERDRRLDPTKKTTYVTFRNRIRYIYGDASNLFIHVAEAIKLNPNISKDEKELLIGNMYEGIKYLIQFIRDEEANKRVTS
jgi:hypothetical protein